jgi:serine/threonine-protein kinase
MSPEQVRGSDIDGRADIYTLGCLLYEILAGEPLHPRGFHGLESAVKGLDARPSLRGHGVPPELDALCVAATQKERDDRIATARELGESVQRYLDGDRDVALRRQLARDHLERARTAFAGEDVATQRPIAMREAAAALALDPALEGPAELVGRLMLEPPSVTPPAVEESIQRDNIRSARVLAAAGLWVVVAAIAFLPLLWWLSDGENTLLGLLALMLAADGVLGQMVRRAKRPRPELIIIANMLLVFVIARMFSPLLIAPGIAASIAIAMVLTPQFSWLGSPVGIIVSMSLGVLAPLVFEQIGWMSPTLIVAVVYVIALITGAVVAGTSMRRQQREAHRRLHLQAWQLRQLVPQ